MNRALSMIAGSFAILNLWFVYEMIQLERASTKAPTPSIVPRTYRELYPTSGSIYRIYASLRTSANELHVLNGTWDASLLKTHVSTRDITHIIVAGQMYNIQSFVGTNTKDACTDFVLDRCDIVSSDAPLQVDTYQLQHEFNLMSPSASVSDEIPDLIEHHIWVAKLMN